MSVGSSFLNRGVIYRKTFSSIRALLTNLAGVQLLIYYQERTRSKGFTEMKYSVYIIAVLHCFGLKVEG